MHQKTAEDSAPPPIENSPAIPGRPAAARGHAGLDLLRGLAAFEVVLTHSLHHSFVDFSDLPKAQQILPVGLGMGLMRLGQEAVLVFFVLSGFLVGGQVIQRVRQGRFSPADYAIDRITRIFLPLIPACLITFVVTVWVAPGQLSLASVALHMVGLNGVVEPTTPFNNPLWTLPYEIWFYVVAGCLGWIFSGGRSIAALAGLLASLLIFSVLDPLRFAFWASGAIMFLFVGHRQSGWLAFLGLALFAGGVTSWQAYAVHLVSAPVLPRMVCEALTAFGVALLLPYLCRPAVDDKLKRIRPFCTAAGAFSYSLYLIHVPILFLISKLLPQADVITPYTVFIFLTKVGAAILVAIAFYYAFERNTHRLRKRLHGKRVKQMFDSARG